LETPDLDADLDPPADLIGFEPVPDLTTEQDTEDELDDPGFGSSFDSEWEPAEGETDEGDSFDLFSASDDPPEGKPTSRETGGPAGGDPTTGQTPRRLLGLFKRP